MDKRIKDLYLLILKKNARVVRFLEYNHYYEIHLEWNSKIAPEIYTSGYDEDWGEVVETKLIALEKVRR